MYERLVPPGTPDELQPLGVDVRRGGQSRAARHSGTPLASSSLGSDPRASDAYFMRALTRSLTLSTLSNSTLTSAPSTFSTRRIYAVWMISRVSGSIEIGPRGLSHAIPFAAPINASPSVLPPVFFRAS